ncbi:MAG: hypothetical protein ACLSV2_11495 [Clostridium sp.]
MTPVRCPICNNRIFDASSTYVGKLQIKCSKCKKQIEINRKDNMSKIEFSFKFNNITT